MYMWRTEMMTDEELKAFVNAYQNIMAYVDADDVRPIAEMLAAGVDEGEICNAYIDAVSVADAYILWGAAKKFYEGQLK
jgi:hypothetical protein